MRTEFPIQRLSYKEKSKNDFEWAKTTTDYIIQHYSNTKTDYDSMKSNYDLYNNVLNQEDFVKECNPLGLNAVHMDTITPYNKTYNKIQVLLGELSKRKYEPKAILINSEGIKSKLEENNQAIERLLNQQLEALFQGNIPPNIEDDIKYRTSPKYLSKKEIKANKLLKLFRNLLKINELRIDSFKHGLLSGKEVARLEIKDNKPDITVVNPLLFFYDKSSNTKYFQDGLLAGCKYSMSINEIYDNFSEYLSKDDLDKLSKFNITNAYGIKAPTKLMEYGTDYVPLKDSNLLNGQYGTNSNYFLDVYHVQWKSQKKIGFVSSLNESDVVMVDEYFMLPPGAKKEVYKKNNVSRERWVFDDSFLEWTWIEETWESYRIGSDIYTKIQPCELQYRSIYYPKKSKLSYFGSVYSNTNAKEISLMDRMKPFQYLYFVIMHRLKKLITHDKPPVFHFNSETVDPALGLDKTLYYLEETGIDFYSPSQAQGASAHHNSKITGTTSRSTMQHINNYISLLSFIDQQISDVAGVSRQREGQISANETVTNAQSNISMSAIITEVYFNVHYSIWDSIHTALTESFKHLKKETYQFILDDYSLTTIDVDSDEFLESDFGIFTTNQSKEHDIFNNLIALTQPLLQNDKANLSDIIELLSADSLEGLKEEIHKSEAKQQEINQQQSQQQAQMQQEQIQAQKEEAELQRQHEILLHQIDSYKFVKDQDANNDGIADQLQIAELNLKIRQHEDKMKIEKQKLNKK